MYKYRNKLHNTVKKWVVTTFAAAAIGVIGYTLLDANKAYAKDNPYSNEVLIKFSKK